MKTQKNKKAGFTLVELMVVAIIVAILAAVAIPLMSGNTKRAMATEGQAGLSTVATGLRVYKAEKGTYVGATLLSATPVTTDLQGIKAGDLNGKYFRDADYKLTTLTASTFLITATASQGDAKTQNIKITLTDLGVWGGSNWQ